MGHNLLGRLKRFLPILQLSFSIVSLVGCASVVTLPATGVPFVLLGVLFLFLPHLSALLWAVWRVLLWVVAFQSLMFAVSITYTFLTEVSDVVNGTLHVTTRFDPRQSAEDRQRMRSRAEYRHLGVGVGIVLLAWLPIGLLVWGSYLLTRDWEIVGRVSQLVGAIVQLVLLYLWYQVVATKPSPHRRY